MATPELVARLKSAFPSLLADTIDVKAARRELMHKNGDVDEALIQEAHRCLVALKTLGVVVANMPTRDQAIARLVAVAIAVHRGLYLRDDNSNDLKSAFLGIWGKDYKDKRRLAVWLSRLNELTECLRRLDCVRVQHLEAALREEDNRRVAAKQRLRASLGVHMTRQRSGG